MSIDTTTTSRAQQFVILLGRIDPWIWVAATVVGAGVLAFAIVNGIGVDLDDAPISNWADGVEFLFNTVGLQFAGAATGFAFLGAIMRAAAHGNRDGKRGGLDFVGKLFAVAAASMALWAALLALPELVAFLSRIQAVLLGMLILLVGTLVLIRLHRSKRTTVPGDLPPIEFAFPGTLRDSILASIESGTKTATSSLLREYEAGDEEVPVVGFTGAVVDSTGEPRLTIQTTHVEIVALRDVTLAHALAEGEGYESVADWRTGHLRFWTSPQMREQLGSEFEIDDDTLVVLERFVLRS